MTDTRELILSSPVAPGNRNSTKELESRRSQRPATDPRQGTSAHASWKTRCNTCLTTTRYDLKASGLRVRSGEWRSLVARLLWEQDAAGSNPVSPISNSGQWLDSRPPKPYLAFAHVGVSGQRLVHDNLPAIALASDPMVGMLSG